MKTGRMVIALVVVLIMFAVVGCGDNETTTTGAPTTVAPQTTVTTGQVAPTTATPLTTAPPATAPPATAPPTTTSTTEPATTTSEKLSSAEILQPDGTIKAMGYIDRVWEEGGKRYLSIDYAEMLSGREAQRAAVEDGVIQPGETLDNDYYIRNQNSLKREFTVSATATIKTMTREGGFDQPATWEEFLSFWGPNPPGQATHLKDMPWWITRNGPTIVAIEEQYLP